MLLVVVQFYVVILFSQIAKIYLLHLNDQWLTTVKESYITIFIFNYFNPTQNEADSSFLLSLMCVFCILPCFFEELFKQYKQTLNTNSCVRNLYILLSICLLFYFNIDVCVSFDVSCV